ncbi:MAG: hypothetical protein EOO60_06235 [Hymenobacter sp.]|nr:MAG: hypothetical protein EOO60_06235 [Hymenobacter sp.]
MTVLLFSLYTILSGAQQGIITWLLREYVPEARKDWIHAALHYGGVLLYLLLVAYAASPLRPLSEKVGVLLIEAVLARALLFDPSLNLSQSWFNHREGRAAEPVFKVGTVAMLDKMLRYVAGWLRWPPERLRLVVWIMSLLAACSLLFVQQKIQ